MMINKTQVTKMMTGRCVNNMRDAGRCSAETKTDCDKICGLFSEWIS